MAIERLVNDGNSKANTTFANNLNSFVAGDGLDIRISTPIGWTSILANLVVFLEVEE